MAPSVSQFFDSYACDFDAIYGTRHTLWHRVINCFFRHSMWLRWEKTLQLCTPAEGKTVLDIGCGPGHYAVALAMRGARRVLGIDFAPAMIELSRRRAAEQGVEARCQFEVADFMQVDVAEKFDYAVLMGLMDYVAQPLPLVRKVLHATREKALFSFPVAGGFMGWQRQLRYRRRCQLFLYTQQQVEELFAEAGAEDIAIEKVARDFFVTVRPHRRSMCPMERETTPHFAVGRKPEKRVRT